MTLLCLDAQRWTHTVGAAKFQGKVALLDRLTQLEYAVLRKKTPETSQPTLANAFYVISRVRLAQELYHPSVCHALLSWD